METICINNKQCEQSADAVYRRITWKNNDERHHALMKHLVRRIKRQPGAFPGSLGNRCLFLMLWASLKTCMGVPWFGYQITPVVVAPFMLYLLYKGVPGTPLHVDEVCGGMRSPLRLPRRHQSECVAGGWYGWECVVEDGVCFLQTLTHRHRGQTALQRGYFLVFLFGFIDLFSYRWRSTSGRVKTWP